MARNYVENMIAWLTRKGYSEKYKGAGIYCIKIDDQIVYIGKSTNMLKRVAQHYVGIKTGSERKYRILSEVQRKGHSIGFDVLYRAQETKYQNIQQEIGEKEGEYIRQYQPILNTQIPKEEDWHSFEVQTVDARAVLEILLRDTNNKQ